MITVNLIDKFIRFISNFIRNCNNILGKLLVYEFKLNNNFEIYK